MVSKETIITKLEVEDKPLYTYDDDRNIVEITHIYLLYKDICIDDNFNSYNSSLCFESVEELKKFKDRFWCWQKLTREV